jgi:hypothetical protein
VWAIQNICYDLQQEFYPVMLDRAKSGDEDAEIWIQDFRDIALKLSLTVDGYPAE